MIVVAGGTGRLGQELIRLFKADGKTVASIARHESPAADHNLLHDLQKSKEVIAAAEEISKLSEPLEALINAVGFYQTQPLGEITGEEMKRNMALHVEAPMLLISTLSERIKKDQTDIVNISSINAINPSVGAPAYGASKAALRGLSVTLREVFKDYPSRVISVCPAAFDTSDPGQINVGDVAKLIKDLLSLPKNMEVSEVIINRKGGKQ